MTDRRLYSLYVDVYENGALKDIRDFTEEDRALLCIEIEDLWADHYRFLPRTHRFVVGLTSDHDVLYLIYQEDGYHSAFPNDCEIREITIGAPKVNQQTLKLIGDRIPMELPGYPGRRLEVMFSDI